MKKRLISSLAAGVLSAAAVNAGAGPLVISNVQGAWVNPVPAFAATINNQAGSGVDTIRWGQPTTSAGQSGYNFDPTDPAAPIVLNTPFLLGTFTHVNQPITGSTITSVGYNLTLSTNGIPGSLSDASIFFHNETPNNASPCPAGDSQPCADIVTVSSVSFNSLITVAPDVYFFNVLGFSTDGGVTIRSMFVSDEGANNSAGLFAIVTATPIPEPTTLALVVLALAGFGFGRRGLANQRR